MPLLKMDIQRSWVFFLLTATCVGLSQHTGLAEKSITILESNACYGSEGHIFNKLECEEQQVVAIQRLSFGAKTNESCPGSLTADTRNTSIGCCEPDISDNCTLSGDTEMPRANSFCSGQRSCSELRAERIRTTGKCDWLSRDYTNYMTTHYRCIPLSRIVKFCQPATLLGSSIYLASENYPQNLVSGNYNCECTVTSSGAIGMYALDVPSSDEPTCGHKVEMKNAMNQSSQSITCKDPGKFGYTLLHTGRGVLNMKLVTKFSNAPWRFWFYIRGNVDMKLVCNKKIPTSSSVVYTGSTIIIFSLHVISAVCVSTLY